MIVIVFLICLYIKNYINQFEFMQFLLKCLTKKEDYQTKPHRTLSLIPEDPCSKVIRSHPGNRFLIVGSIY